MVGPLMPKTPKHPPTPAQPQPAYSSQDEVPDLAPANDDEPEDDAIEASVSAHAAVRDMEREPRRHMIQPVDREV